MFNHLPNSELLKLESELRDISHAKVRDVTPAEKSRIAGYRAEEWLRCKTEIKRRGLDK